MKKNKLAVFSALAVLMLASCGSKPASSASTESEAPTTSNVKTSQTKTSETKTSTSKSSVHKHSWDEGKTTSGNACEGATIEYTCKECGEKKTETVKAQPHEYSFIDHKGLIDLERCDECSTKAYKFPIKYASGYNDPSTKMNAKTGDAAKSKWNITGQLAAGKYSVEITMKVSTATDRHWYNHAIAGEETASSNPDTTSESAFRYWIEVDGKEYDPTSKNTFGEDGFTTTEFNRAIFIDEVEVTAGTKEIALVHGNIGYTCYIETVRLVAKNGTTVPDKLPAAPEGVFDPEGNTGGDTGGSSTFEPVDTSNVPDVGKTPGGEGESVYGKSVTKKIIVDGASQEAINLTSNADGAEVSVLHPGIQDYVDAMYAAEAKENLTEAQKYKMRDKACGNVSPVTYQGKYYENGKETENRAGNIDYFGDSDRDNFKNVVLNWDTTKTDATSFYVEVGMKSDLSDAKVVQINAKEVQLSNLFVSKTYYWRVTDVNGRYHSKIGSFVTKGSFRNINAGAAYNVRDIGGKMTSSGKRVKQGVIYRGGELTPAKYDTGIQQKHIITLDKTGKSIFHDELNVRVELDFRNAGGESNNQTKSYLGDDVKFDRQSVSSLGNFYNGDAAKLKSIFTTFANATVDASVYCHCWGGADRTGTAFFLLEGLLGVSYSECLMDYEFTSFDSIHTRRRDTQVTDYNGYNYNFPSLLSTIKGSSYYSSTKTFQEVCEAWLKGKVKMTDAEIQKLKTNLLED
ncbi:MAG: tyrosine-protein phosphatase [Bacilli bacterium]|nr:tyrosine-protein phosphatase [Bacilli bacterium]